jgi:hypothetical protein
MARIGLPERHGVSAKNSVKIFANVERSTTATVAACGLFVQIAKRVPEACNDSRVVSTPAGYRRLSFARAASYISRKRRCTASKSAIEPWQQVHVRPERVSYRRSCLSMMITRKPRPRSWIDSARFHAQLGRSATMHAPLVQNRCSRHRLSRSGPVARCRLRRVRRMRVLSRAFSARSVINSLPGALPQANYDVAPSALSTYLRRQEAQGAVPTKRPTHDNLPMRVGRDKFGNGPTTRSPTSTPND